MSDRSRWDAMVDGSVSLPVNDAMGFTVVPTDDPNESISFTWKVPREYCNSVGNLQGGVLAAFADCLLGGATSAHLGDDHYPALAEMKLSIFRPASAGATLNGTGYVLKRGTRIIFVEAEIRDEHDALIAKASGTEIPTLA
jgi:uncharacterized protein (TIGR00369 family)